MAFEAADWTVTRLDGSIRYIGADHDGTAGDFGGNPGTPSYATVIDFHRWLQGLADDAVAAGDDELDITNTIPSQRSTDNIITLINGYDIDDTAAEHLYDGSVIQAGGAEIYDGIVNFGNADVQIQIIQNGIVIADDWWNYSGAGLNADATSGISHRFMIMVRTGGNDIDARKLIGTCRRFSKTYSEFTINATARGNNVLALNDSSDLNNGTLEATVGGWSAAFSNTEGYRPLDIDNNSTNEYYYSEWNIDRGSRSINDFYEYTKYLTREGSAASLYGLSGELFRGITHDITVTYTSGTYIQPGLLSWGSGGTVGTGQLFAANSATPTHLYIQILTGAAPNGTITGTGGTPGTATVTSYLERTISKPFSGASTGSALIGSYGLGVVAADLSSSDSLTDLSANVLTPPNNVTNNLTGLVNGEDRVLVAPRSGTDANNDPAINKAQMTIATTALIIDPVVSITVNAIPAYTPAPQGYIRVTDNDGFERRLHYSAITGTTFTIDTTDGNEDFSTVNANIGNNAYIAYIDALAGVSGALAFTSVHPTSAAAMDLVIIVRDGGEINSTPIKQYIAPWTQTDSNNTATAIRTSDL